MDTNERRFWNPRTFLSFLIRPPNDLDFSHSNLLKNPFLLFRLRLKQGTVVTNRRFWFRKFRTFHQKRDETFSVGFSVLCNQIRIRFLKPQILVWIYFFEISSCFLPCQFFSLFSRCKKGNRGKRGVKRQIFGSTDWRFFPSLTQKFRRFLFPLSTRWDF